MIPHPDDCNWIDPAVRPYSRTELELLLMLAHATRVLDGYRPPAPVRDTYASRTLAVAA